MLLLTIDPASRAEGEIKVDKVEIVLEKFGFELNQKEYEEIRYRLDPRKTGIVPIAKL